MSQETEYKTLREFWPYYLSEHRSRLNRALHFVGSLGGIAFLVAAFVLPNYWLILAGLVNGYAFAWVGHFVVEKNRPATFKYPLKSFLCDWYMLFCILTFRIGRELKNLEAPGKVVSEPETVAS